VLFSSDRSGADEIYRTDTAGSPPVLITAGAQPAWCGPNLAFVRDGDIFIARADGTAPQQLTRTTAIEAYPTCSPDGGRIAFSRSASGGMDIYSIDLANHRELRLTNGGVNAEPQWSPSGAALLFVANNHIAVMQADGSGKRALTRAAAVDANPAWLGDSKILFDRTSGGESHLWVTGIGGGTGEVLTHEPGDQQNPSFSSLTATLPIVFQARDNGNDFRIYAMTFSGSIIKQLTTGPGADVAPAIKPLASSAQTGDCQCTNVRASLSASAMPATQSRRLVRLTIRWTLNCSQRSTGAPGKCQGRVGLAIPQSAVGFFTQSKRRTRSKQVTVGCATSTCGSTTSGATSVFVEYSKAPVRTIVNLTRFCSRRSRYEALGKAVGYELRIDARARPSLQLR
jgi:hypothetical protein